MADYDLTGIVLPCSPEAEKSVIGAIVGNPEGVGDVSEILEADYFYSDISRAVYSVALNMFTHNERIDLLTLSDKCARDGVFDGTSAAMKYLADAVESTPSFSAAKTYAKIIVDKYLLRSLILASKEIIDAANMRPESADEIVDYAEQKIYDIRAGREKGDLTHISGIAYDRLRALTELEQQSRMNGGKPVMTGLSTGFTKLDECIFGLKKTDLLILAARPGMGKTSFVMNIATKVAMMNLDKDVCVFSLEMSKEQIVMRMLCSEALLPNDAAQSGRMSADQLMSVSKAVRVFQKTRIFIDDTPGVNVASIKSKLRRMKNLGLVIIDYLQLMSSAENYGGNRVGQMSEITRNLKIMAKELNVPIIALSQLARGPEQRVDKRPMLSDLRDSGSIEQDADIVMFLYRNSYYEKDDPNQNICECIVAKNRHGETGTVRLGWQGEFTKFTNVEYSQGSAQ